MTYLLIMEESDQDEDGIDTVLMLVPTMWDKTEAVQQVDGILRHPQIKDVITLDDMDFRRVHDLGEYRPFTG